MSHDQKLEPDPEQRTKYLDFIDIYADLDDHERTLYTQRYPQEAADMSGFAQRFIEQGVKQGVQHGEARVLTSLLRLRFGELPEAARQRLDTADADTLLRWSTRVLTAQTLAEVLDDAS